VLSGLVMATVAKYRRRSPYFAAGHGTEAGTDTVPPAAIDAP
jgi:hypothetical protein